jgi:energy-coupling factor transporter ATP-binding protein EcfA2
VELATAAVMAGLTVALSVVAILVPVAGGLGFLATVPMGIVAQRHRPRALLAAAIAATAVAFVVAGTAALGGVWMSALLGGLVGDVKRRRRGPVTAVAYLAVAAPVVGALADGLLLVFSATRNLALETLTNSVHGIARMMGRFPALTETGHRIDDSTATLVQYWWLSVPTVLVATMVVGTWLAWVLLGAVIDRVPEPTAFDQASGEPDLRVPEPLPVTLREVGFRYPGMAHPALSGINLTIEAGEFLAVVGPNGSGKSTLTRILAGHAPTSGTITRAGSAGLGRVGGTALVLQRPESQILGVRVADDVVWGLPSGTAVDVDEVLAAVGLAGMGDRETSTLSGGELQRLAVAAALARRPALLLSDESTAMVDAEGRSTLVQLFAELARTRRMAIVHITHREAEAVGADRVVHLQDGRMVDHPATWASASAPVALAPPSSARPLLQLVGVSHTYAAGTPWAQPALHQVDLTVREGEGLLLVGGNGSGKSTLAWVLAGLLRPEQGQCLLDGRPVAGQVGAVALAFQHARLQVQRPTVGADIAAAAGMRGRADWAVVAHALQTVGLDPALAARPVDQLSGGQLRRVALAGLLVRRPRVLVLDEPLAGLDTPSRRGLVDLLAGLRRDAGLTVVAISHDLEGMSSVCSRTVRLEGGRLGTEGCSELTSGVAR